MASVVVYGPPVGGAVGALAGLLWLGLFAAFIALIAWAVIGMVDHEHRGEQRGALATLATNPAARASTEDEALTAARARYASGQINREQYFQVVEDLTGVSRPAGSGYAPAGTNAPSNDGAEVGEPGLGQSEA